MGNGQSPDGKDLRSSGLLSSMLEKNNNSKTLLTNALHLSSPSVQMNGDKCPSQSYGPNKGFKSSERQMQDFMICDENMEHFQYESTTFTRGFHEDRRSP